MRDDLYTYEEEMFVEAMFNFDGIKVYDYSKDDSRKEKLERDCED